MLIRPIGKFNYRYTCLTRFLIDLNPLIVLFQLIDSVLIFLIFNSGLIAEIS